MYIYRFSSSWKDGFLQFSLFNENNYRQVQRHRLPPEVGTGRIRRNARSVYADAFRNPLLLSWEFAAGTRRELIRIVFDAAPACRSKIWERWTALVDETIYRYALQVRLHENVFAFDNIIIIFAAERNNDDDDDINITTFNLCRKRTHELDRGISHRRDSKTIIYVVRYTLCDLRRPRSEFVLFSYEMIHFDMTLFELQSGYNTRTTVFQSTYFMECVHHWFVYHLLHLQNFNDNRLSVYWIDTNSN